MTEATTPRELWGAETRKAIANFPISGEPIPPEVARWLARIKAAAARVNAELGLLEPALAERIAAAADRVAAGEFDDQFPLDVFQTGSGTSSNMNANEVIAALAGEGVHPNDHVNMGQSSNDVFPSAVHLAALDEVVNGLLPALRVLADSLGAKAVEFDDVVKSGRTHLMDAVPVTLGQEFRGYEAQVREGVRRVEATLPRVGQIPLGGTATGTGLNTHPEFAARVRARLEADSGLSINPPADPFEAQAARDGIVELSGALKTVAVSHDEDRERHPPDGFGAACRARRAVPAGAAEGELDHAREGEPGDPRGGDAGRRPGRSATMLRSPRGRCRATSSCNVFVPLMGRNVIDSITLLASVSRVFAEKCIDGIEANRERCRAVRRADAVRCHCAQPVHRLRPRVGDRQGGSCNRALAP